MRDTAEKPGGPPKMWFMINERGRSPGIAMAGPKALRVRVPN